MDLILLPGLWLPRSIWDGTVAELAHLGRRASAPRLPGVDDGSTTASLADQLAAVLDTVDGAPGPVTIVGHSAAATLAWLAADRRPERVHTTVMIGGFPAADGATYADFFPIVDGVMPFPGWEPFDGPDAADLDETGRATLAAVAVPVPHGVAQGAVRYGDPRRHDVPVVLICPEFTPDQAREWIDGGQVPELSAARRLSYRNIESGHWPMVTRTKELALLLAESAG
jgi:pimeloyl-ACP methyl ester carboxylesterase